MTPKNGRKPSILILLEISRQGKMAAKPYFMRVFAFFLCPKFWGFCKRVRPFVCQLLRCFFIGRTWRPSESNSLLSIAATRSWERYRLFSPAAYWA